MIARAHDLFDLHPERLAADTGFGSAEMLDWLVNEQGIEPHVPVFDKSQRTGGTFSRNGRLHLRPRTQHLCLSRRQALTTSGTLVNDGAARPIVLPALLNSVAAPTLRCGGCRGASTKALETWPVTSPRLPPSHHNMVAPSHGTGKSPVMALESLPRER
jgi:hypothetical protein